MTTMAMVPLAGEEVVGDGVIVAFGVHAPDPMATSQSIPAAQASPLACVPLQTTNKIIKINI
jgi:hypothetical protein